MANLATATRSLGFELALSSVDKELQERLTTLGIHLPNTFAHLVRAEPGTELYKDGFRKLAAGLTPDEAKRQLWALQCEELHTVARGAAPVIQANLGKLTGFQLSADSLEHQKARKRGAEETDLKRLAPGSSAGGVAGQALQANTGPGF